MKKILAALPLLILAACAQTGTKEYIEKHPEVIFKAIEDNPTAFMAAVEKAANQARREQADGRREQMRRQQEEDLKNPKQPKLDARRALTGGPSSEVVIVEYADFQCPACAMARESLKEIKAKYGSKVRFHYKNMPLDFHPAAMPAAQAFEAVRLMKPAKAMAVYDWLFENQKKLSSPDFVNDVARTAGVPLADLKKKMASAEVERLIREDMEEFEKFGFTGTPVVLVNGVALHGAQPAVAVEQVIEATRKNQ